jgi:hypothetical protein
MATGNDKAFSNNQMAHQCDESLVFRDSDFVTPSPFRIVPRHFSCSITRP